MSVPGGEPLYRPSSKKKKKKSIKDRAATLVPT